MKSSLLFVGALLLPLPPAAAAETAEAEIARHLAEEEFRGLDINGDGFVSSAEAAGFGDVVTRFDKADRNRDGKLSRAEYSRLKRMKVAKAKSAGKSAVGGTAARKPQKKAAD